jgi:site-specific DNA-adenine methylase
MQLLVGSSGFLLNNNKLGILLSDFQFTMMLLYKMLRTKVTEIYQHLSDLEKVEFMPLLPILTQIW